MAYPQGNASQNMDLGIYTSDFSPDITVGGIVNNHTAVNKLGLRNSLGYQVSLLENFVCQDFLGRLSSPVSSGYINYLRGGLYSSIHYGSTPTATGSYTYIEPGVMMTKYEKGSAISGVTITESTVDSYRVVGNITEQTRMNGNWLQFNSYNETGTWNEWGSGLLKMVRGYGDNNSNPSSFIIQSTGDIILDTGPKPYTGTVIISGNVTMPSQYSNLNILYGTASVYIDSEVMSINEYSGAGRGTSIFPGSIQIEKNARMYGFNSLEITGKGPIVLDSERGSFNDSYITMSGEQIFLQATNVTLDGETHINGILNCDGDNTIALRQNPEISMTQQAYTFIDPGLITIGSGTGSYMTLKFDPVYADRTEIFGINDFKVGAANDLIFDFSNDLIIEPGLPSSDPGVPGALYRSGGAVMISL